MTYSHSLLPGLEVHRSRVPAPVEPPRFRESYTVGVDLGQSNDSTAIAVVRRFQEIGNDPVFHVGHLERLPLGTTYPAVVAHVMRLLSHPQIRGKCDLALDFTGVGRPVADMFDGAGVSPIKVSITAGNMVTHHGGNVWGVPKGILISRLDALLQADRLHFAATLPETRTLVHELQNFQVQYTASGHMTYNARVGKHDDMILALAIAIWRAFGDNSHAYFLEYMNRQIRDDMMPPWRPAQQIQRVMLKRPAGDTTTTIFTIRGRCLNLESDIVEVAPDEATPFMQQGWTLVIHE